MRNFSDIPETIHGADDVSPREYFDMLATDLTLLGVHDESEFEYRNGDIIDYDFVIKGSAHAFDKPSKYLRTSPNRLQTDLGKAIYRLGATGLAYHTDETTPACMAAEGKFVESLDPEEINEPVLMSPLIVTHQGEPAAVIKSYGESSALGLRDIDEHHIVRGAIMAVSSYIDYSARDSTPYAQTVDAEVLLIARAGEEPNHFKQIRFTSFMIPPEVKQQMSWWYYKSQKYGVDDISQMADDAMRYAKPLPVNALWSNFRRYASLST